MKKSYGLHPSARRIYGKTLLMRCMLALTVMLSVVQIPVKAVNAQVKEVTLNAEDVEVTEIFNQLKAQTNLVFVYKQSDLENLENISIKASNKNLSDVMNEVLAKTNLTYAFKNNMVIIKPRVKIEMQEESYVISGTVYDDQNLPIPGVNIVEVDQAGGTVTSMEGTYTLKVKSPKSTLRFSYIGFKSMTVEINGREVVDVYMEEDVNKLGDVVVTGVINKSKESFTGSVTSVKGEELMRVGSSNVLQSLQAFVPGLVITENTDMGSNPNSKPDILIRGRSSFANATNVPTFILDGAEVTLTDIFDMDINDVESVTVLKDAAASSLYGSRAANGVIVIKTKSMQAGRLKVSYSGYAKLSTPDLSFYDLLNAEEKLEYERLAGLYSTFDGKNNDRQYVKDKKYNEKYQRIREGVDTDWMAKPLRTGVTHNHNIRLYGGDAATRYALSARYGSEEGVMKGSKRDRYSINFRLSYNIDRKLFFNNTTYLNGVQSNDSPYGSFNDFVKLNPYERPYNEDGTFNDSFAYRKRNPMRESHLNNINRNDDLNFRNTFNVKWNILEDLRLESNFSISKSIDERTMIKSPESRAFKDTPQIDEKGSVIMQNTRRFDYQGQVTMAYNKVFNEGTLLTLVAGSSVQENNANNYSFEAIGLLSDKLNHPKWASKYRQDGRPTGSNNVSRMLGSFVNANFIYKNRYFTDFSYRIEGSSKFGSEERIAPFWSLGLGYNLHHESFMKNIKAIDRFKLRGSYGYVGNASFNPYEAVTTYEYSMDYLYDNGVGAIPLAIGNPHLGWERTRSINAGIDAELFKNRFTFSVDFYNKLTNDILIDITKAPSVGVGSAKGNLGEIVNKGIEVKTRAVFVRKKDWEWSASLSATHNQNKILKISNALKEQNKKLNETDDETRLTSFYEEGESLSAVKVVKSGGIDPATGKEIYINRFGQPTFKYDYRDKIKVGDSMSKINGFMSSYLQYKNLSLDLNFQYRLGATIYNETLVTRVEGSAPEDNADQRVFDSRWKQPGDVTLFRDIADRTTPRQSTRFIQDEFLLRLSSVNIGYDFNPKLLNTLKVSRLRCELMMNDIFTMSSIKQEKGLIYPYARSFQFSVYATF